LGRVWVKDESRRLGFLLFKILGASWGIYSALETHFGRFASWQTAEDLAAQLAAHGPLALAAATDGNHGRAVATDGNHGRAVARMARLLGLEARIFVPKGTARARINAIRGEGARRDVVDGSYKDAVARSAEEEDERCLVISDTSWPGYEDAPR
jgi:diaminopropionate ammonia-lyase